MGYVSNKGNALDEEKDRGTALGNTKHWHLFNFIARK